MTAEAKKQIRRWIWFVLSHCCFIWLIYVWAYQQNEGAGNVLMILFWLLSSVRLLCVFAPMNTKYTCDNESIRAMASALFVIYGGLMAYHGAIVTGAVMIVSECLFAAKYKSEAK